MVTEIDMKKNENNIHTKALIEKRTRESWMQLADGNTWIDESVLTLFAIALQLDILVFIDQPESKVTLHTILSGNTKKPKKPILLLLRNQHYTPIEAMNEDAKWYKICMNINPPMERSSKRSF